MSNRRGPAPSICLPPLLPPSLLTPRAHLPCLLLLPPPPLPSLSHLAPHPPSHSLLPLPSLLRRPPPRSFSLPLPRPASPCGPPAFGGRGRPPPRPSVTPRTRRCITSPARPSTGGGTRRGEGRRAEGRLAVATPSPPTTPHTLTTLPPHLFLPRCRLPPRGAHSVCSGWD